MPATDLGAGDTVLSEQRQLSEPRGSGVPRQCGAAFPGWGAGGPRHGAESQRVTPQTAVTLGCLSILPPGRRPQWDVSVSLTSLTPVTLPPQPIEEGPDAAVWGS